MNLETAIKHVYLWQHCYREVQAGYYTMLLNLISKADEGNKALLNSVYPEMTKALDLWRKQGERIFEIYKTKETFNL